MCPHAANQIFFRRLLNETGSKSLANTFNFFTEEGWPFSHLFKKFNLSYFCQRRVSSERVLMEERGDDDVGRAWLGERQEVQLRERRVRIWTSSF